MSKPPSKWHLSTNKRLEDDSSNKKTKSIRDALLGNKEQVHCYCSVCNTRANVFSSVHPQSTARWPVFRRAKRTSSFSTSWLKSIPIARQPPSNTNADIAIIC
jgi:hypothetical protein